MSSNFELTSKIKTSFLKAKEEQTRKLRRFGSFCWDKKPERNQSTNKIQTAKVKTEPNLNPKKDAFKQSRMELSKKIAFYLNPNNNASIKQMPNDKPDPKKKVSSDRVSQTSLLTPVLQKTAKAPVNEQTSKKQIKVKQMTKQLPKIMEREIEIPENCDLSLFFENERYVYNFFSLIHNNKSIYYDFKEYFVFIQEHNFDVLTSFFASKDTAEEYKTSMIMERISIFICFYMDLIGSYRREIEFLKKLISLVFANSHILIKNLISNCESDCYRHYLDDIVKRKLFLNEEDMEQNNKKLARMLESQIKELDPTIGTCFEKIGKFQPDFSLNEAFKYLLDVFSALVA